MSRSRAVALSDGQGSEGCGFLFIKQISCCATRFIPLILRPGLWVIFICFTLHRPQALTVCFFLFFFVKTYRAVQHVNSALPP